jgi:hypothetical protein
LTFTIVDGKRQAVGVITVAEGSDVGGATQSGPADPVALLKVSRWRSAEEQLFSGLLHDPPRYERCVLLLAAIRDRLQTRCPTTELALDADPGLTAAQAAAETGLDVAGLDLDLVGAAALANHWWYLTQEGPR